MAWMQGLDKEMVEDENSEGGRAPDQGMVSLATGIGLKVMSKKPFNEFLFETLTLAEWGRIW